METKNHLKLIILQVYLFVGIYNFASVIYYNMSITQVVRIRSFFLEASKWQPNAGVSAVHQIQKMKFSQMLKERHVYQWYRISQQDYTGLLITTWPESSIGSWLDRPKVEQW